MKTFNDLKFNERNYGGIQAIMDLEDDVFISVVAGENMYSTPKDNHSDPNHFEEFEVALMKKDSDGKSEFVTQDYFPNFGDDVMGYQNRAQINTTLWSFYTNVKKK